jgi:hypothetical protein
MKTTATIDMIDVDAGTTRTVSAADVPSSIAVVDGVAVARIEKSMRGTQVVIRSYSATGALLQTTTGQ